jgi:hypothetical protein
LFDFIIFAKTVIKSMPVPILIEQFRKNLKEDGTFSRDELFSFYRISEPDLKETTFRWRIYNLKAKNIIIPISRKLFSFGSKPVFYPEIESAERKIFNKVEKQFPSLKQCIWSTKAITEFMLHMPVRFLTILEIEKEALEPVFYFLKDAGIRNVYLQPEEKEIELYISELDSAVIIQSLITKAPTQQVGKMNTTTIEKMLVDLYCDKKILFAYQGNELVHIINTAYSRYKIDFTRLLNYAKRRGKDKELLEFLLSKTDIPDNILK